MATAKRGVVHVAIDDGFRQTKILTSEGFKASIPSVAKTGFAITRVDGEDAIGGYETENTMYTVDADIQGEGTGYDGYALSPINRVLVHHAMHLAGLEGREIVVCTGVPYQFFFAHSNSPNHELINAKKKNLSIEVKSLNGGASPIIVGQQVAAQGLAACIDYLNDEHGAFHPNVSMESAYAVVDIGGRTTDVVTVLKGGTKIEHGACGTFMIGVGDVYTRIEEDLRRQFRTEKMRLSMLDRVARLKMIRFQGQEHDVSSIVDLAVEEVAQQIIRELMCVIGDAGRMEAVLLTGGGAVLMQEAFKRVYPHCVVMDDPGFANARGMLKVLNFGASHG